MTRFSTAKRFRKQGSFFLADTAVLLGDVEIGAESSVWFQSVLRGDDASIHIGARTNIQDLCMVHPEPGDPTWIGDEVTIGHGVIMHGRKIGHRSLIGMGAVLLGWSEIGEECILGARTLILEKTIVPPRSLVVGSPGKVIRRVTDQELEQIRASAQGYIEKVEQYLG